MSKVYELGVYERPCVRYATDLRSRTNALLADSSDVTGVCDAFRARDVTRTRQSEATARHADGFTASELIPAPAAETSAGSLARSVAPCAR